MDQQGISRETVARLRAEQAATCDEAHAAALENQIRIHAELAGPEPEPAKPKPAKTAKPAEN